MFIVSAFYLIIIVIVIHFLIKFIKERKFKNQKYLTKDKTILITGGSLGIGRQIINILITIYNCHVINLDIRESEFESMKELYKENIINIQCNIAKIDNIITFLKEKKVNPDEIDIVINNAGVANNVSLEKLNEKRMISTIEINLIAPMKIIKAFIDNKKSKPELFNKQLHFVTLCSVISHIASANSSDYIASKWGIYGFMESVRSEYLYNDKYIFTSICPYAINTGMFPNFFLSMDPKYVSKEVVKSIALKENIKFLPKYIDILVFLYKFFPVFISDIIQKYIVNPLTSNIGRRKDNDELLK